MKTKQKKNIYRVTKKNNKQIGKGWFLNKVRKTFRNPFKSSKKTHPYEEIPMTENPLYQSASTAEQRTPNPLYANSRPKNTQYSSLERNNGEAPYYAIPVNENLNTMVTSNNTGFRINPTYESGRTVVNPTYANPANPNVEWSVNPAYKSSGDVVNTGAEWHENPAYTPKKKSHKYEEVGPGVEGPVYDEVNNPYNNNQYGIVGQVTNVSNYEEVVLLINFIDQLFTDGTSENQLYKEINENINEVKKYLFHFLKKELEEFDFTKNTQITNNAHIKFDQIKQYNNISNRLNNNIKNFKEKNITLYRLKKNSENIDSENINIDSNRKRKLLILLINRFKHILSLNDLFKKLENINSDQLINIYNNTGYEPNNKFKQLLDQISKKLKVIVSFIKKRENKYLSKIYKFWYSKYEDIFSIRNMVSELYNNIKVFDRAVDIIMKKIKHPLDSQIQAYNEKLKKRIYLDVRPNPTSNTPPPKRPLPKGSLPQIPSQLNTSNIPPPPLPPRGNLSTSDPDFYSSIEYGPSHANAPPQYLDVAPNPPNSNTYITNNGKYAIPFNNKSPPRPTAPKPRGGYKKTQKHKITKKKNKKTHKK